MIVSIIDRCPYRCPAYALKRAVPLLFPQESMIR
jgi:hypothetical protein